MYRPSTSSWEHCFLLDNTIFFLLYCVDPFCGRAHWTPLVIAKTFLLTWCISTYAHTKKTCENLSSIGGRSSEILKWKKKKTLVAWSCVLSDAWGLEINFKYFSGKLLLSRKLRYYFRGSRFSQCFILSTALRCLLPSKFYADNYFE